MTTEEAIEILKTDIALAEFDPITGDSPVCYNETAKQLCEAEKLAINALEKQIPKKPLPDNENHLEGICPNCGVHFLDRLTEYCGNCGQKICW